MSAITRPNHFDSSRITQMGQGSPLKDNRERSALMLMVADYIEYILSDPQSWDRSWDKEEEHFLAKRFVQIIDNDVAWGLARQMVHEFQRPLGDTSKYSEPFKTIIESVAHRLAPPAIQVSSAERFEREYHWQKYNDWIGYLVFLGTSTVASTDQRRAEVARAVAKLKAVEAIVDADYIPDEAAGDEMDIEQEGDAEKDKSEPGPSQVPLRRKIKMPKRTTK